MVFEAMVILALLLVFFQDMKYRAIHISLLALIAGIGLYIFIREGHEFSILTYNFAFLLLTFTALYLYLALKSRRLVSPFASIGQGDLLFFIAIIPYFSTTNYILFFVSGMLFSILSFLIIKSVSKTDLVPLAGLLAAYFMLLKGTFYGLGLDFFNTKLI